MLAFASSRRLTQEQTASWQIATRTERQPIWITWICLPWAFVPSGPDSLDTRFYRFTWCFLGEQWLKERGASCSHVGPPKSSLRPPQAPEGKVCQGNSMLNSAKPTWCLQEHCTVDLGSSPFFFCFHADQILPIQYQFSDTLWYNQVGLPCSQLQLSANLKILLLNYNS